MRTYKKFDFAIQLMILAFSIGLMFFNFWAGWWLYLAAYFVWDMLSVIIHAFTFKVNIKRIENRRIWIFFHAFAIIGIPILLIYMGSIWSGAYLFLYGYLLYAACLPLYYLWMSHRELKLLDEIYDQVHLIDVSQH